MIVYDSHRWRTLLRVRGSVGAKAILYSLPVAAFAFVLKLFDNPESAWHLAISESNLVVNSAAYAFLMSTTAFILVFRTNQCYSRFWMCSTSICTFRAQLLEAAGSLHSFLIMSKTSDEEISIYKHKSIRLFSLLHALALGVIADMKDEHFPVIGIAAIDPRSIEKLEGLPGRQRVQLVYAWINAHVVKGLDTGLLNIPPPILSRVFQELEKAMIEYEQVMQVMEVLFPFPYVQVAVALILLQCVFTPFVMCYWTGNAGAAGLFTFLCIACLFALEFIATELENPCGDDANDLPCHNFQDIINESLLLMFDPDSSKVPELAGSELSWHGILERGNTHSFETRVSALQIAHKDDVPITAASLSTQLIDVDVPSPPQEPGQPNPPEEAEGQHHCDRVEALLHEQSVFHHKFLGALTSIIEVAQTPPVNISTGPFPGKMLLSVPLSTRTDAGPSNSDWVERLLLQQRGLHDQVLSALTEMLHRLDRTNSISGSALGDFACPQPPPSYISLSPEYTTPTDVL